MNIWKGRGSENHLSKIWFSTAMVLTFCILIDLIMPQFIKNFITNNDNNDDDNNNNNNNNNNNKNNILVFWFFIFKFAIVFVLFLYFRDKCQPMHI